MKRIESVETALECGAAASFGTCVAFSGWLAMPAAWFNLLLVAPGAGILAFFGAIACLRRVDLPIFSVPEFAVVPIESAAEDELLLTDVLEAAEQQGHLEELVLTLEQRLGVVRHIESDADVLLLDDMLAHAGPESRVVRLFDPAAIPTPGALRSRIDRHLQDQQMSGYPDAAQALNDALADLRRSLR